MRTFKLSCPKCGADEDHAITLDLNDLSAISCSACSDNFTPEEAREYFREQTSRWNALISWIEDAPFED